MSTKVKKEDINIDVKDISVEIAGDTATCIMENTDAFYGDLPKDQVKAVFDHNQAYIGKCAEVAAEMATSIMKKNKKVDHVSFKLPYSPSKRGAVNIETTRSKTFTGIGDRPDVTRSDLTVKVKDPLVKVSTTEIKELRANMTSALLG